MTDRIQIFISHHADDRDIAEAFAELLREVSMGMFTTFRSTDTAGGTGVPSGVEYFPHLNDQLQASKEVVCLLTERSYNRPWILWEAGVARGHGRPVHGVRIDVDPKKLEGPFIHLQGPKSEQQDLVGFCMELLRRHGLAANPPTAAHATFVTGRVSSFLARQKVLTSMPQSKRTLEQILIEVEERLDRTETKTLYVGRYPERFEKEVCHLIDSATISVEIACDYPAYGFLTNQTLYLRYKRALMQASQRLMTPGTAEARTAPMRMIVSSAAIRQELIQLNVPREKQSTDFLRILRDVRYEAGLEAIARALKRDVLSAEDLYSGITLVNQTESKAFGFPVFETSRKMPVFAWIVDGNRAAFAIPTYLEGDESIEHAFSTEDDKLIGGLRSIVSLYLENAPALECDAKAKSEGAAT